MKTKTILVYGQTIITDMSEKEIPKEDFNRQDLLEIERQSKGLKYSLFKYNGLK